MPTADEYLGTGETATRKATEDLTFNTRLLLATYQCYVNVFS